MGAVYKFRCPKCRYTVELKLGVGFAYPRVYAHTQAEGKRGNLGDDVKEFLIHHPDGVLNPELTIARCEKCGEYEALPCAYGFQR